VFAVVPEKNAAIQESFEEKCCCPKR